MAKMRNIGEACTAANRFHVASSVAKEFTEKLAEKMNDAFDRVWDVSQERGITLRTAALVAGIREVAGALDARGLYP